MKPKRKKGITGKKFQLSNKQYEIKVPDKKSGTFLLIQANNEFIRKSKMGSPVIDWFDLVNKDYLTGILISISK